MRRILMITALAVFAVQASAASRNRIAGASWVKRMSVEATAVAETSGARPIALIETNYYTFLPAEPLQVRITTHPNGYGGAVTMYLYRENRTTGERRYYNIASSGLLPAGQHADLFGSAGAPVTIGVPELTDFVLFGSSSDQAAISWGINGALGSSFNTPAGEAGLFQWVLELRDHTGKRVISRSNAMYSNIEGSVTVSGTISADTRWTANQRYVLNDFVGVAAPATLTIEPGTVIYGGNSRATLFIQRGAKIVADGTVRRPIVFTSPQKVGERAQTDWGSLVLLGNAPINDNRQGAGEAVLEGLPDQPQYRFGGNNPADSSGVLRYVRLEFGGFQIETNQEINGLTLAGVGNGTVVDHIEVLHNKDDAFEFFGGTVNARHLLGVAFADDGLDWDLGYTGNIQYAVMIKREVNDESDGNVLIEADGHPVTHTLTPLSNPRVYNITGWGTGSSTQGNYGAVLRRGTAGKIGNAIIAGARRPAITIRDTATFNNAGSGELAITSSIFAGSFGDSAFGSSDNALGTRNLLFSATAGNRNIDPLLAAGAPLAVTTLMPDLVPLPGSPALDFDFVAVPPDDGFFEPVDFIGGVSPRDNWLLSGWAVFSDN